MTLVDSNLGGSDFKVVGISSWKECADQCSEDDLCKAWTWTLNLCYMKNEIPPQRSESGVTSGYSRVAMRKFQFIDICLGMVRKHLT